MLNKHDVKKCIYTRHININIKTKTLLKCKHNNTGIYQGNEEKWSKAHLNVAPSEFTTKI